MGTGWGQESLRLIPKLAEGQWHFFSHACMNGHRQIRACVPLCCVDESRLWFRTFGDFLPGCMRLKGRAALCTAPCEGAPGYLLGV